jgi:colanic acid biosynthesis glycosyl transferase WcaI
LKILYVSQYFPPEMGAPAARVAELSRSWTEAGHEVTVLTGFPNHPTGVVAPEYRRKLRRLVCREQLNGISVVRTWLLALPNRRRHERIMNYGSFSLSAAVTGMFLSQPDVVIATSPQLLTGVAGWWLARCKGVPFILEIRDLWPESLEAVRIANQNSFLYRTLKRIAGFLYRACDRLVVVTTAFEKLLVSNWRIPSDKISVVENGVDTDIFKPRAGETFEIRSALKAENKFVISYIGTLGLAQGLETVVEAAARLQSSAPQVLFVFLGEGAEKQRILSLVRERGLTNVRFIDQQPREKIPAYITASDACLVPLLKSALFNTVLPTKLLEFMSCARPVILGVDGLARQVVRNANAGICVQPENSADLANAILQLAGNPALCTILGQNGRRYILRRFSRPHTAEIYMRILQDVISEQPMGAEAVA